MDEGQLEEAILSTAVSPTFDEIGKLAAVATIRTALQFFLGVVVVVLVLRQAVGMAVRLTARPAPG